MATGIGEKLLPLELELGSSILIVTDPLIQVSTREAYTGLRFTSETRREVITNYDKLFDAQPSLKTLEKCLHNDFEPSVFERYPKLAEIKEELYVAGAAFAMMSGSGSAIFGLFEDTDTAKKAQAYFSNRGAITFLG